MAECFEEVSRHISNLFFKASFVPLSHHTLNNIHVNRLCILRVTAVPFSLGKSGTFLIKKKEKKKHSRRCIQKPHKIVAFPRVQCIRAIPKVFAKCESPRQTRQGQKGGKMKKLKPRRTSRWPRSVKNPYLLIILCILSW